MTWTYIEYKIPYLHCARTLGLAASRPSARASKGILHTRSYNEASQISRQG